ncbi:Septin spn like protein [Termitomyces sp. J132]|nr:Septin spn like protein [Termitomyces sp. J132]
MAEEIRAESYVGFDSITQQIEHKLLKRGFQFNVILVGAFYISRLEMESVSECGLSPLPPRLFCTPPTFPPYRISECVPSQLTVSLDGHVHVHIGQTGLGKSTLINTLFASHLVDSKGRFMADEPVRQTTEIQAVSHVIVENGVKLRLNIVDTPGYGDQIDNENCWDPIIKYIKDQHSAYLRKELTAMRDRYIQDTRIHCCLYFINPTGHGLRAIDVIVMKKLSEVVNVVPVIAKSDSLTHEERDKFKMKIREELQYDNINLYPFDNLEEDDEEEQQHNVSIRNMIPFAIVGSENNVIVDGKSVRGRRNRWGVVNVENPTHCEFVNLRDFLLRTHLQDLIETTAQIHYEAFRSKQLLALKEVNQNQGQRPGQQQPQSQLQ